MNPDVVVADGWLSHLVGPFLTDERIGVVGCKLYYGDGRTIIPGIGAGYCSFDEIEARIETGCQLGVAGYVIFSYSGLKQNNYFDELRMGLTLCRPCRRSIYSD